MNGVRKFAFLLEKYNIKDYENYEPIRGDGAGSVYLKNKINNKHYIASATEKLFKEVNENEAYPEKEKEKEYEFKEKPLYLDLEAHDVMSNITKEKYDKLEDIEKDENSENQEIDGYDFDPVETTNKINEQKKIDKEVEEDMKLTPDEKFEKEREKIQKEFEEMKRKQQEEIKKKIQKQQKEKLKEKKKEQKKTIKENTKKVEKKEVKKQEKKPRGWHLMAEYVDSDGNVFHKGKEQPKLKGTKKPTKK
jgi:flagellar biosynthesis GTPase FlhF